MIVDPGKCAILRPFILEEKEDTLEEKKLKRLINLRDNYIFINSIVSCFS